MNRLKSSEFHDDKGNFRTDKFISESFNTQMIEDPIHTSKQHRIWRDLISRAGFSWNMEKMIWV